MNLIERLKSYKKTKSIREAYDICEYLSTLFDCELSCNTAEPLIKDEDLRMLAVPLDLLEKVGGENG